MLIRVRCKDGNFRYELQPTDDVSTLLNKISESSKTADPSSITISQQPKGNETPISSLKGRSLQQLGMRHGDLLFVTFTDLAESSPTTPAATSSTTTTAKQTDIHPWESVTEDAVDVYWRSQSGQIPRGRDSNFCRHGLNGMCDYCTPIEPYDAAYHKEHKIKHLSFHAYLRKITPKSSNLSVPPLNTPSYKVKSPCPVGGHSPWPAGICTNCQPSAITLQSQPFRMVDHLEIASMEIVDRFLHAWRMTGLQRFGWLIGRYEPYDKVPMGVKAVAEAIYEPPQQGELDGLTLGLPWEDEPRIKKLLKDASIPLTVVGFIFTDLDPTPEDRTKNIYKRHPGSFYVSSLEAIFAAKLQNMYPTTSRSSPTGLFSSRLVTAVLTATEDGAIDVSAYQVSEQACAMVDADMIEASVDPGIVRVKEEDRSQDAARYVPDVFFSYKNDYGLEVKKSAKPAFPVEYLLVTLTHGFPQNPSPLFQSTAFAIENRPGIEDQTVDRVLSKLASLGAPDIRVDGDADRLLDLARFLSDCHLITFLGGTQLLSQSDMQVLMRVASSLTLLEQPRQLKELFDTEGWQTLMVFTRESAPPRPSSSAPISGRMDHSSDIPAEVFDQIAADEAAARAAQGGSAATRICPHCTFENPPGGTDCEVCCLPLG